MNDQPTDNVKLNFDQLQAIDTAQKRLAVIESEIAIANKTLKGTKLESDRAIKERAYQEELLVEATKQVDSKQAIATKLDEDILEKTSALNTLNVEINDKKASQEAREMRIKNDEASVATASNNLLAKERVLAEKVRVYEAGAEEFNSKVAKLKEVISIF